MGALFKGVCYPTEAEAQTQACSSAFFSFGSGADVHTSQCVGLQTGAMQMQRLTNGTLSSSYLQTLPPLPECSYDGGVSMALEFFGAALALLVVVWCGRKLAAVFWKNHDPL